MKFKLFMLTVLLSLTMNSCYSKELTEEYKQTRIDAQRELNMSYKDCLDNARKYKFWIQSSLCLTNNPNRNNCFNETHHNIIFDEQDMLHCEIFKPTLDGINQYLSELIKERNIKKWQ